MTRKRQSQTDRIEQEIEQSFRPGTFIHERASFSFVSDLEEVAAKVTKLIRSESARAVTLFETFLAACYLKIEEVDDSCGSFGLFVDDLYCSWIKARQANGADPDETASRLLAWMDQDDYGFSYELEKDAVKVFNKANLAAFVKQIRSEFDAAGKTLRETTGKTTGETDRSVREHADYIRRSWGAALRRCYVAQKDVTAYVALAEETGLTAMDCLAIAKLLVTKRKPTEALSWVERGIDLDGVTPHESMASHDLSSLKRDLLTKLGRGNEALEAAWTDYCQYPSIFTFEDLMKYVPKTQQAEWHQKAVEEAMGAGLSSALELLLQTKEMERLADRVRRATDDELEDLSHYHTQPVAKELEKTCPDLAARLWRAQGLRIVNAKKSKYYTAALSNFESAKRCFECAGLESEWEKTVSQVRADHKRKVGFMPGFELLVAGTGPKDEPSFLDQARAQWSARERRTR